MTPPPSATKARRLSGLTAKQAGVTLALALFLGLGIGVAQLMMDLRSLQKQTVDGITQSLDMVRDSAAEAAYQMNPTLGERVVAGLLRNEVILRVELRDDFGGLLGQARSADVPPPEGLAHWLFDDIARISRPLDHVDPVTGQRQSVGRMDLWLDKDLLTDRFLARVGQAMLLETLRSAAICGVLVAVFFFMITRPLLRVAHQISRVDADRPGQGLLALPQRHGNDELGLLVDRTNALLAAFQSGLDQRDRAEADLHQLNRDLEQRVADRTRDLQLARDALARESSLIAESIRYASRIQAALLPPPIALAGQVADLAVRWRPRDVVGGDLYWFGEAGGRVVLAVFDCTGHGVPGAFMTAIAAAQFDRALHELGPDDPAALLTTMDRLIRQSLRQDAIPGAGGTDDGLDAAIAVYDPAQRRLVFAGASLCLYRQPDGGAVERIKGDRSGLGYRGTPPSGLTNHVVPVAPGDRFYLVTDGIIDQVGGPQRRSFGWRRFATALDKALGRLDYRLDGVLDELARFQGDEPTRDDITLLGVRFD